MLHRHRFDNGLVGYQSPLLARRGVVHVFTTRIGGVSPSPFDALDLGLAGCGLDGRQPAGGEPRHVRANYQRLLQALRCDDHGIAWIHQVHADGIFVVEPNTMDEHPRADALVTAAPGVLLTVRLADCASVLLSSDDGRVVAAVHAGWRGVVAGVAPSAIAALAERFGVRPERLVAALGPCIGPESFEVGAEVAAAFVQADLADACIGAGDPASSSDPSMNKPRIDLRRALRMQLRRAGIADDRIDTCDRCTVRDGAEFFSHRRDRGVTGRMVAAIAVRRV